MEKFEIDKEIIDETIYCHHSYACLDGDLSHCGNIEPNGDNIVCKCHENQAGFCHYRIPLKPSRPVCACFVRKEIYRKYKV
jgi:hypothetical protein